MARSARGRGERRVRFEIDVCASALCIYTMKGSQRDEAAMTSPRQNLSIVYLQSW